MWGGWAGWARRASSPLVWLLVCRSLLKTQNFSFWRPEFCNTLATTQILRCTAVKYAQHPLSASCISKHNPKSKSGIRSLSGCTNPLCKHKRNRNCLTCSVHIVLLIEGVMAALREKLRGACLITGINLIAEHSAHYANYEAFCLHKRLSWGGSRFWGGAAESEAAL